MENIPATLWIAACAHRLRQRWHTVDALELEDVARTLRRDARLRAMLPDDAAVDWLRPLTEASVQVPVVPSNRRPSGPPPISP
ncbi:hypothetical protein [Variovorax sp. 770b2]|jgi:hypothetical protein|uniref:hypothetical protein n=1 Tax=Variovorax sp. 770b2 TaxID=1566271 RepID=UPI0008E64270|nr:hypothetical protein [Variovorax sp. 770b2]SFP59763.1 hypothetical protein SAMN03159339_3350 [Variovorax sp. 770b2]